MEPKRKKFLNISTLMASGAFLPETGEHTGYFETWEIAVAALAKQ